MAVIGADRHVRGVHDPIGDHAGPATTPPRRARGSIPAMSATILRPEAGPTTLRATRWAGARLAQLRGGPELADAAIGESWEFSTIPGRVSRAEGAPLDALLGAPLPFLAKLIDTALPLSLQLHPDDDPAQDRPGKEEAWMILEAEPGAEVWVGLREGVSGEALADAAARARADRSATAELFALLRAIPAAPGTIVLIPARTIHAIGGGILLAEIQQPVDCTYRLFDHGSGRPLHVDEALAHLDPDARATVRTLADPPAPIRGKHLELRSLRAGVHRLAAAAWPRLLVIVRGAATIDDQPFVAGDLALWVAGPATIEIAPGGVVALGSCDAPSSS